MNFRWSVLLIVICLILPGVVLAADLTVSTKLSKDVRYESFERSAISQLLELFGISEKPLYNQGISVYLGEKQLAVVPVDSKLANIKVHDFCLENYGYGTDSFVVCEATI